MTNEDPQNQDNEQKLQAKKNAWLLICENDAKHRPQIKFRTSNLGNQVKVPLHTDKSDEDLQEEYL